MSDPGKPPNGRIWLGPKELLTVLSLVFMAGGGWTVLNAQGNDLEKLEDVVDTDHDTLTKLEGKIELINEKVKGIQSNTDDLKTEQANHRAMLQEILRKVSR